MTDVLKFLWSTDALKTLGLVGILLLTAGSLFVSFLFFTGKWGFEELAPRNKIRREFAAQTAKHVSDLADLHYWTTPTPQER